MIRLLEILDRALVDEPTDLVLLACLFVTILAVLVLAGA